MVKDESWFEWQRDRFSLKANMNRLIYGGIVVGGLGILDFIDFVDPSFGGRINDIGLPFTDKEISPVYVGASVAGGLLGGYAVKHARVSGAMQEGKPCRYYLSNHIAESFGEWRDNK